MFTKQEIHAVLQLSPKFNNEHVALPFTASEIPDAVHKALSEAYAEVDAAAKTTSRAVGFALRKFADEGVLAVIEGLKAPVVEEVVAKPPKKAKVEKVEEPVVEEPTPVVEPEVVEEKLAE